MEPVDVGPDDVGSDDVYDDVTPPGDPPRRPPLAIGVAGMVVAALLVWTGTAGLSNSDAYLRAALVFLGLGFGYLGLDRLLWRLAGHKVQTDLWLSVAWMSLVVAAAALADLLPLPESRNASASFGAPVTQRPDLFSAHPLGTDTFGLDLLGGVIYGARLSLQISFGAVAIGFVVGGLIGVLAGFLHGWFESVVNVLTDSLLAFPPLILLIALMVAVNPTVVNLSLALALLGIPTYIRLARANTLVFAQREFVTAARGMGATRRRIIFRELVPNVALPLLSYAFIIVAVLIVAEGSLSFLGLSIPRPEPTWGNMISAGANDLQRIPHLVFVPASVMFLTVFSLNRIGDRARQAWDPRESKI